MSAVFLTHAEDTGSSSPQTLTLVIFPPRSFSHCVCVVSLSTPLTLSLHFDRLRISTLITTHCINFSDEVWELQLSMGGEKRV